MNAYLYVYVSTAQSIVFSEEENNNHYLEEWVCSLVFLCNFKFEMNLSFSVIKRVTKIYDL